MSRKTRNEISKMLVERFGTDLEIVDANSNLKLYPLACDSIGADPRVPNNCLLDHTAARMFGSKGPVFWKGTAYIDLVGPDGVRRVYRYIVPLATMRVIEKFDAGQKFIEGTPLLLLRPRGGQRLKRLREDKKKWNASPAGRAYHKVGSAMSRVRTAEARAERTAEQAETMRQTHPASPKYREATREAKAARADVRAAREHLHKTQEQAAKVKRATGKPLPKKPKVTVDLVTRNGMKGNYNFVPAHIAAKKIDAAAMRRAA